MKIIATRKNADGTFDEAGLRNRILISNYKTVKGAIRFAVKPFGQGKTVRCEVFNNSIYDKPSDVFIVET
jgi:hypothetical protein